MEGTRWKEGDVRNSTSSSNGRLNTIRCILGENYVSNRSLHWTEVLNPSEHYGLTDDHQDALHAVLLRNRDLNGDNIVQPNEIRWYLAAIDQLVDLYIGEYALDDASRLYPQIPRTGITRPIGTIPVVPLTATIRGCCGQKNVPHWVTTTARTTPWADNMPTVAYATSVSVLTIRMLNPHHSFPK